MLDNYLLLMMQYRHKQWFSRAQINLHRLFLKFLTRKALSRLTICCLPCECQQDESYRELKIKVRFFLVDTTYFFITTSSMKYFINTRCMTRRLNKSPQEESIDTKVLFGTFKLIGEFQGGFST